jgi:NAD(P)-dependent dehydrogenase (short-subunit alcohol dehydrogenase family)
VTIALVTGTSSGIGQATAIALARRGHKVYAAMRNLGASRDLLRAAGEGLSIAPIEMDVDQNDSVSQAIGSLLEAEGRVDILVNNAGVGVGGAIEETPLEEFRRAMETNFFGALRCTQAVLPMMRTQRGGCIVNISSVAGRIAQAPQAAYAASKWALEAMSECLAQEIKAFGVRVALVEPGLTDTPMLRKPQPSTATSVYPHARRQRAMLRASLARPASPLIVAELVCDIVADPAAKFRHPVGPDANPFITWRASKSDEEMIDLGGANDAQFVEQMKRDFGFDIKL